jgi:tetratricopeptide (TPR) repeat protein
MRLVLLLAVGLCIASPLAGQAPGLQLDRVAAAERAWASGDRDAARRWASPVAAAWERAQGGEGWSASAQIVAGRAWRILGEDDPAAVRQALAAFDAATRLDSASVEGRLWAGDLLLERYNAPDARVEYREVLAREGGNARALLGLARAAAFEGSGDAAPLAMRSVAADDRYAPALHFLAQLLLESEQYDSARVVAERGLALDSTLVEGWGTLGAVHWLADDSASFVATERRVTAIVPRPASFHVAIAEAAARHRRYADAVRFATRGTELDSLSARAWGVRGINQLRVGAIDSGRASLERAFARDPFHIWHKNTLDLLDRMAGFRTMRTARFEIVAPARDAELLGTILGPLLEAAYDALVERYDYRPPTPIRLELFARHADFSVRTVGLTGMGALGVSFGTVLAMDAPAARPPGSWNIGSTAWHELAHTFTLGASAHRVPRWVSEGLSVVEERRARAGWGAHASVDFLMALHRGELLPISRLNEGFTRPTGPGQLTLSYYQASLVMEQLEADFGITAIQRLLRAYADGLDSEAALIAATGLGSDSLDARFTGWLRERFAVPLAGLASEEGGVFGPTWAAGQEALAVGNARAAVTAFRTASERFPEYGGADGPLAGLALAYLAVGDTVRALEALVGVTSRDETALEANQLEARVRLARGDSTTAMAALERATWIAPEDVVVRRRLAEVAGGQQAHAVVVRERRAIAALSRTDPLTARTDLAEALLEAGDPSAARAELLTVLEAAPAYERAQALLLRARAMRTGGGTP